MSKSKKQSTKRQKVDNCNLLNAKPYSRRNTKYNFNRLKYIISLHELLVSDHRKKLANMENEINKLLELCKQVNDALEIQQKSIEQERQLNAYMKDVVLEFGDHFDWNDLMFESTHLKMHLNTNHRIN